MGSRGPTSLTRRPYTPVFARMRLKREHKAESKAWRISFVSVIKKGAVSAGGVAI